jgi:hypothetical protein
MKKFVFAMLGLAAIMVAAQPAAEARWRTEEIGKHGERVYFGKNVDVRADETVQDLVVFGGHAVVEGTVDGDAVVFGGDLILKPSGRISGDAVALAGEIIDEGGSIGGDKVELALGKALGRLLSGAAIASLLGVGFGLFWALLYGLAKFFFFFLIGVVCLSFLPEATRRVSAAVEARPGHSFFYGLILALLAAPASLLLLVSLIGIPLIPVLWLLYAAAYVFGTVAVAYFVGLRVTSRLLHTQSALLAFFIGMLLLRALALIPFFGWILTAVVALVALGAVWLTRFGSREVKPPAATAPVSTAV